MCLLAGIQPSLHHSIAHEKRCKIDIIPIILAERKLRSLVDSTYGAPGVAAHERAAGGVEAVAVVHEVPAQTMDLPRIASRIGPPLVRLVKIVYLGIHTGNKSNGIHE